LACSDHDDARRGDSDFEQAALASSDACSTEAHAGAVSLLAVPSGPHIHRLRQKVDHGFQHQLIHTVLGAGYVIREPAGTESGRAE